MKNRTISSKPERFFALHMSAGLAEYRNPKKPSESFRVLIEQEVANELDPTFQGCPVYVLHEDDVDLDNLKMDEVDGLVVKSFYNKPDGNNWVEFLAVTDQAKEAIKVHHWKVSNCSITDVAGPGGRWQGSEYRHSIKKGHYEHLAIVPNPRYTQSIVLTPEEFREYNARLEEKLTRLNNSVEDETVNNENPAKDDDMKLSFFNIEVKKLENSDDISKMSVKLPKSGKTITVSEAVVAFDEAEHARLENAGKPVVASDDHVVKLENGEEVSVKDLKKSYNSKKKNEDAEQELEEDLENEDDEKEEKDEDKSKNKNKNKNSEVISEEDLRLKNNDELNPEQIKRKLELLEKDFAEGNFNKLKNAASGAKNNSGQSVFMSQQDKVAAGAAKYGSAKK